MDRSLADALSTLRRRYGEDAVHHGREGEEVWPTGWPAVDGELTPGGLPRGRLSVLEPHGEGATGRLTLLQALAARASRSAEAVYVDLIGTLDPGFLADLGADLASCLVVTPGRGRWGTGLVMARALAGAGVPWLGIALDDARPRTRGWELDLAALAEAVWRARSICVVAAPVARAPALAHASSLTLACRSEGWQEAHGDVVGLRVRLSALKSRMGAPGSEAAVTVRYPRPFAPAAVISSPLLVEAASRGGAGPREQVAPAALAG